MMFIFLIALYGSSTVIPAFIAFGAFSLPNSISLDESMKFWKYQTFLLFQADLGDRTETTCFRPEDYVPPGMRGPAALRAVENAHRTHRGLSRTEARARFISESCRITEPVNAHVFKLRASKMELAPGSLLVAVCAKGLRVCPDNNPRPLSFGVPSPSWVSKGRNSRSGRATRSWRCIPPAMRKVGFCWRCAKLRISLAWRWRLDSARLGKRRRNARGKLNLLTGIRSTYASSV